MKPTTAELDASYATALDAFRAAHAIYQAAALQYRARTIDDDEFLAAHRALSTAASICDQAELALLNAAAPLTRPGFYCSTYCNKAHRLSDGKPVAHECRILPPAALDAERRGFTEQAIALIQAETTPRYMKRGIRA